MVKRARNDYLPVVLFIAIGLAIALLTSCGYAMTIRSDSDDSGYAVITGYSVTRNDDKRNMYFPEYDIYIGDTVIHRRSNSGSTSRFGEIGDTVEVWHKHFIVDRYVTEYDLQTSRLIMIVGNAIGILCIVIGVITIAIINSGKNKVRREEYGEY